MFGDPIGRAKLKDALTKTINHFGTIDELKGKEFPVIDRNRHGDCIVIVDDGKYLVDVSNEDIESFTTDGQLANGKFITDFLKAFARKDFNR